jgi:hypothetical protein
VRRCFESCCGLLVCDPWLWMELDARLNFEVEVGKLVLEWFWEKGDGDSVGFI